MRALVATGTPEKPLELREVQRSLEGKAVLTID
jgi:hypothetical protein